MGPEAAALIIKKKYLKLPETHWNGSSMIDSLGGDGVVVQNLTMYEN